MLAYWCQHVDPDGAEDDAEAKRSSRLVHLSQGFGDLWFLDGVADLARSAAQRRADALVEMARRAGTAPEGGRRPEPLFTVVVGYETLHGRICQG